MEAFAKDSREGKSGGSGLGTSSNNSVQRLSLGGKFLEKGATLGRNKVGASKTNSSTVGRLGSYQGTLFSMTESWWKVEWWCRGWNCHLPPRRFRVGVVCPHPLESFHVSCRQPP